MGMTCQGYLVRKRQCSMAAEAPSVMPVGLFVQIFTTVGPVYFVPSIVMVPGTEMRSGMQFIQASQQRFTAGAATDSTLQTRSLRLRERTGGHPVLEEQS